MSVDRDPSRSRPSWLPLVACSLASFLLLAFATVATVSVPKIQRDLGAGYAVGQWILDGYTLALAALVLALGTMGDRFGHRRLFLAGLGFFTAATFACAAAPTGVALVGSRIVQGVGGAAMFATCVPILVLTYEGSARTRAFAVWSTTSAAGSTVGTIAGGAVTQYASWRWLFLGAVPLCVLAVVIARLSVPAGSGRPTRTDRPGVVLVTASMAAFTYAAINAGEHGWWSVGTVPVALGGALAAVAFVGVERRSPHPLLPPELFATGSYPAVLLAGFTYYLATFAAIPAVSTWLQDAAGLSALHAGFVLTAQLAAFIVVSLLVSARLHARSRSWVLGGGTVLTGIGALAGAAVLVRPEWTTLVPALVITGVGAGMVSPVLPAAAATSVPPSRTGVASAAANASRQLGLTIGVALCGALAHRGAGGQDAASGLAAALELAGMIAVVGGAVSARLLTGRTRCDAVVVARSRR